MIRILVGIVLALFTIAFSWVLVFLVIPFAGILTGLSAVLSVLVTIGVFMILPTLIILGIIFLIFIIPVKLIKNSRK